LFLKGENNRRDLKKGRNFTHKGNKNGPLGASMAKIAKIDPKKIRVHSLTVTMAPVRA
jgi:hypothetical protein